MSKARLVITAVVVEGRSQSEVARAYGVSQPWVSRLVARYKAEGDAAFEPRSRRPHSSPSAVPPPVVDRILELRKNLSERGLDAGPHTLVWHLQQDRIRVSPATISRILTRHGAVVPDPAKRPKSSYRRFQAELPNQLWQSDFTHWQLADGSDVEILNWIDDHSATCSDPPPTARSPAPWSWPSSGPSPQLTAFPPPCSRTTGWSTRPRFAGGRRGRTTRNGFEQELARLGIQQKNSSPNHPQTGGKVERLHQTLKKWLAKQSPARTLTEPQAQLDRFRASYNEHRPHRALARTTPAAAYTARPKATPTGVADSHDRVRRDRIDDTGVVTIRYHGRLHHIGIGRTHARTHVLLLIHNRDIRVINEQTGELLRELVLDPTRDYQPQGKPGTHEGPNP
jgi:transposase InsO family protein